MDVGGGAADLVGAVGAAVAGGAGHEEAVDEVGDGFLAGDAGQGGEDDGDVELDAAEDVGLDDGGGDVGGVGFEDEEDTDEADDCDAGGGLDLGLVVRERRRLWGKIGWGEG